MTRQTIFAPIVYPEAYLVGIIILAALTVVLFQLRRSPGALQLCLSRAAQTIWLASCIMFTYSQDQSAKLFWAHCAGAAVIVPPLIFFDFVTVFFRLKHPVFKLLQYLVRILLAGCLLLVILDAHQIGWLWESYQFKGQILFLPWAKAGLFNIIATYLATIAAIGISLWQSFAAQGFRRKQAIAITIMPLFIFGSHAINRLHIFPPFLTLMFGMLLSSIYITWMFYRWRVFDILPLAYNTVSRNMIDGLLVVDDQGYVVELNDTARSLFDSKTAIIGKAFSQLAADWPELRQAAARQDEQRQEVAQWFPEGIRYFMVEMTTLMPVAGQIIGKVFVLKEITAQKRDQNRLMEQEKALSRLAERNSIGRELHDTQGQFPGYVKTQTQAIRLLLQRGKSDDAASRLDQLIAAADDAYSDARESITGLNVAAQDWDLFARLQEWLNRFQAMSGMETVCTAPNQLPVNWISTDAEVHLLRIIQESFTNVRKHANASRIELGFSLTDSLLTVTVADNGQGFDIAANQKDGGSYGLKNISQRTAEIGGTCSISSSPGSGTVLTVRVPLTKALP